MKPADFGTAGSPQQKKLAKAPPPSSGGGTADAAATFKSAGCAGCHTFTPAGATGTIGPNLDNLAADAAKYGGGRVGGRIRAASRSPTRVRWSSAGTPNGVMPATFGTSLTSAQIDALVAYLLKGGG